MKIRLRDILICWSLKTRKWRQRLCLDERGCISSIALTVYKSFQNPINIEIKEETKQILSVLYVRRRNKETRKTKQRKRYRTLLRLFLPTHLHQFNKFLRTIWRNFWCQSFVSVFTNQIIIVCVLFMSQQNMRTDWKFTTNLPNSHSNIKYILVFVRFTLCNNFIN
jgi:hypothetical protein